MKAAGEKGKSEAVVTKTGYGSLGDVAGKAGVEDDGDDFREQFVGKVGEKSGPFAAA